MILQLVGEAIADLKKKREALKIFNNYLFNNSNDKGLSTIIDFENLEVHILFYIATTDAIQKLEEGIRQWQENTANPSNFLLPAYWR